MSIVSPINHFNHSPKRLSLLITPRPPFAVALSQKEFHALRSKPIHPIRFQNNQGPSPSLDCLACDPPTFSLGLQNPLPKYLNPTETVPTFHTVSPTTVSDTAIAKSIITSNIV
ncbi:hypothetical protein TNCV_4220511 [Trichonephila clavipes]|nr:hypothetical protein TNCV_4220511 [Trichonephila clavipes]